MEEAIIPASKWSDSATAEAVQASIKYRAEPRFFILLLLGLGIYFISASIGSGWALFLACGLFCCCILALALPVLALRGCCLEISAPEQVSAGDQFPVALRIRIGKKLAPLPRMLILRMVAEKRWLYENSNAEVAFIETLDADKSTLIALNAPGLQRGIRPLLPCTIEGDKLRLPVVHIARGASIQQR
jgi:hypothetical protein